MRVRIQSEQQIQRINQLLNQLKDVKTVSNKVMAIKPSDKSWSGHDVIKHMSIAHKAYQERVGTALKNTNKLSDADNLKCSAIPSYLIKRFPPIKGKVKLKIKTTKQFKPINIDASESVELSINELENCLNELKGWVDYYRSNKISLVKFNSAVGALVRFNVPEACEFILCHNERHFFQLKNTLDKVG